MNEALSAPAWDPDPYPKACAQAGGVGCSRRAMLAQAAVLPPFYEGPGNEALTLCDFFGGGYWDVYLFDTFLCRSVMHGTDSPCCLIEQVFWRSGP